MSAIRTVVDVAQLAVPLLSRLVHGARAARHATAAGARAARDEWTRRAREEAARARSEQAERMGRHG